MKITSSPPCASCAPKYPPAPPVPKIAMRILKFPHKPAKAVDQSIEAGETQQPSQRHLGRSDDRFTDPRLKLFDDEMRAEIEAGGDQPIGLRIPSAERAIGFRLFPPDTRAFRGSVSAARHGGHIPHVCFRVAPRINRRASAIAPRQPHPEAEGRSAPDLTPGAADAHFDHRLEPAPLPHAAR